MDNKYNSYVKLISEACSINTSLLDVTDRSIVSAGFCKSICGKCDYINTHIYGTYEASRWGGKYIYFCHIGLTFISASIYDEAGSICGGAIAGPVILGEPTNYYDDENITALGDIVNSIDTKKANSIAELMSLILSGGSEDTNGLLNEMYRVSGEAGSNPEYQYPIDMERELQSAISTGNKAEANRILNNMLGHIFFSSGGDIEIMKARAMELAVLLSRASIEGGADTGKIMGINNKNMTEISRAESIEEISKWLISVMNVFSSYVFDFSDIKHSDVIHKTIRYIKDNYSHKISLEEIADHIYLSKTYLSKLFKDETGMNLTAFINKVRIEQSKALLKNTNYTLVEIGNMVGFDDQSYFTRIFTRIVGQTPGRFRSTKGKIKK